MAGAYSRTWSCREDALLALYKQLAEMPLDTPKEELKNTLRASVFLVRKAIRDVVTPVSGTWHPGHMGPEHTEPRATAASWGGFSPPGVQGLVPTGFLGAREAAADRCPASGSKHRGCVRPRASPHPLCPTCFTVPLSPQVFQASLKLLKLLVTQFIPKHRLGRPEAVHCVERTIPVLLSRTGDTSARLRLMASNFIQVWGQGTPQTSVFPVASACCLGHCGTQHKGHIFSLTPLSPATEQHCLLRPHCTTESSQEGLRLPEHCFQGTQVPK